MFTGIVEQVGEVREVRRLDEVVVFAVAGSTVAQGLRRGDSVAVNGCCLTVIDDRPEAGVFHLELVPETLKRTSLGAVAAGTRVNLERALPAGGRLGGHIVQGHVDGVGSLLTRTPGERSDEVCFSLPAELSRYVVEKGSIAVDGVSLTVLSTGGPTMLSTVAGDSFTVALIPTTLADTTLGTKQPGDVVNLEVDIVAKYVAGLAAGYLGGTDGEARTG